MTGPTKKWADGPFPLIKTPFVDGDRKDDYILAGTQMSPVHNVIIRGLNAIHLQSPHVRPADHSDFLGYCRAWPAFIHLHRHGGEAALFPNLEKLTGVSGLMDGNHAAFAAGLKAYDEPPRPRPSPARGSSAFGNTLVAHLADEIPTILALARHRDRMDIAKILEAEYGEVGVQDYGAVSHHGAGRHV